MQLNYDIVTKDEIIVRIQGDLDINTCDEFRDDLLEEYKKNPKDIRIDATDLSFIDSTGLGALINVYNELRDNNHKIYIDNIKKHVNKVFTITEMDKIFVIKEI
ncbi:STAS domain-containing protein [Finegoldia magna]|uniref:STAS domain-containing protein n=1 Tax=Finegoldia magna TaxID=1260 RepID=UPI001ED0BEE4|nr:STAS domain-containing protein [Finegoldia magna]MBS5360205.1 STAS domain-containing protein [Finegoldia magna]